MDPTSVLRTLWRHRLIAVVVLTLTAIGVAYVLFLSPRSYASTATYAIVNPQLPTAIELERDPALRELNDDNPYLRSSDNSLAAQVLVTVLNSADTVEQLEAQGLSTRFAVTRSEWSGQGLLLSVTSDATSPEASLATTRALGTLLYDTLEQIQTVNGADERYLFTALEVESADRAEEQVSDRLRAVVVVGVAGFVVLFGAVSIARALDSARSLRPAPSGGERPRRAVPREAAPTAPVPTAQAPTAPVPTANRLTTRRRHEPTGRRAASRSLTDTKGRR